MSAITEGTNAVRWRQLHWRLWVGTNDDRHVGTIEHGHGYTFTEPSGAIHSGYKTLLAAQDAATGPILITGISEHALYDDDVPTVPIALITITTIVAIFVIALTIFGLVLVM